MSGKLSHLCILVKRRAPLTARPGSGWGKGAPEVLYCPVFPSKQSKTSHFSSANLVQDNLAFLFTLSPLPTHPHTVPRLGIGVVISLGHLVTGCPHLPYPHPRPPIRLVPGAPWRAFTSNRALKAAPCHKCQPVTVDSGDLFEKLCFWSWIKGLHFSWRPAVGWLQCQEDTLSKWPPVFL